MSVDDDVVRSLRSTIKVLEGTVARLEAQNDRLVAQNDRLVAQNDRLAAQNERLHHKVDHLTDRVDRLRHALEAALRASKRQAGPFSKGNPKKDPKKPGRKPGAAHGPTNSRPAPSKIDRVCDARLPESCSDCGGKLLLDHVAIQYQWDLPPIEPTVTQFNVHVGHCADCGCRSQGRHPEQTSDALGAASRQIGPNALALATHLNKIVGAPFAKIADFFKMTFRLTVAPATLVRALLRTADRLQPAYERIRALVRASPAVYPDETGWRIGGHRGWLWVFVGDRAVLYVIARYRGYSVARWAIGENYAGYLVHDGWPVYKRFELATHQSCLAHLLVRCRELLDSATRRAVSFPRDLKAVLKAAFELRDRIVVGRLSAAAARPLIQHLKRRLADVLSMRLTHPGNARLARHVAARAEALFTFVEDAGAVEGTNWPAEQAIRPAVISRKISGCNRSWRGAHAHEVLVSVLRTAWHRNVQGLEYLVQVLRARSKKLVLAPAFLCGP
jgi:transposase